MARVTASAGTSERNSRVVFRTYRNPGQLPAYVSDDAISMFLTDTPAHVAKLRLAGQRADRAALRKIAHYLKGAAGFFAADGMTELCHRLELLAGSGDASQVREIIGELHTESARVCAELGRLLRERQK